MHTSLSSSSLDPKSFIDSTFPSFSSLKGIPDVIDKLKAKKQELESQSQDMRNSGRIAEIHHSATDALTQLARVESECEAMAVEVRTRLMGEEDENSAGKGGVKVVTQLRTYTAQVQQLEQARKYLVLLLKIQELDAEVRTVLSRISTAPPVSPPPPTPSPPTSPSLSAKPTPEASSPTSPPPSSSTSPSSSTPSPAPSSTSPEDGVHDALAPFLQLLKVHELLEGATKGPLVLKEVLNHKISELGEDLVTRARSAFKTSLHNLGWPSPIAITPSKIDLRTPKSNEPPLRRSTATDRHADNPDLLLLGRSFTDLLVLQSSLQEQQRRAQGETTQLDEKKGLLETGETLWVMDIMLEPIIKRFRFHFSGKKATNRIDKPEWPLHHAKKIVQEHTAFLSLFIQNLLLEEGSRVDAKTEFVKGLILAINTKFRKDIGAILSDKHLLFHTVKELLAFEKHMRAVHAYPVKEESGEYVPSSPSLPTVMDILEDEKVFELWLQAEIELGVESLYAHLSAPGAWETEDSEDHRAAKCAHMLLALLHSFTERFRYLKAPEHQLAFFHGTQHRLLEIFLKEVAVWREWKDWKDWREWWGTTGSAASSRWIEMMEKWCIFANSLLLIRSAIKDWSDQLFFLLLYKMKLEENGERETEDGDVPLVGSIFEDILKQYKSLQKQFVEALITNISSAFKRATTAYLKKKKLWGAMPESSDISAELCAGLEDLSAGLRRGSSGLAPSLFGKVWRGVAVALDNYVVSSILPPSSHAFASGGAAQFVRDMHALFLLFRPYSSHPENHFKCIKDVIKIATLPEHESKTLQARLEGRERDVLVQYSISKLDEDEALSVCNMRVG